MAESQRQFLRQEKLLPDSKLHEAKALSLKAMALEDPKGYQTITISNRGKTVRLNDYLPEGVWFAGKRGAAFEYLPEPDQDFKKGDFAYLEHPRVSYAPEEIDSLYGRLGLLHEMAHAIDEKVSGTLTEKQTYNIDVADEILDSITEHPDYKKREAKDAHGYMLREFVRLWDAHALSPDDPNRIQTKFEQEWAEVQGVNIIPRSQDLSYGTLGEALRKKVREERAAWAGALNLYRRINVEKGIDILDAPSRDEIRSVSESISLKWYQDNYGILFSLPQLRDQV